MSKQINGYQDRVRTEYNELRIKYDRLTAFIAGSVYPTLIVNERVRLKRQINLMADYLVVLNERIEWFNNPDD